MQRNILRLTAISLLAGLCLHAGAASVKRVLSYGFIDLEGAKPSALIVEYDTEIQAASLTPSTYEIVNYTLDQVSVTGRERAIELDRDAIPGNEGTVTKIYVNTLPEPSPTGGSEWGRYVVIEVNTDYMLSGQNLPYTTSMMGGVRQLRPVRSREGIIPPDREWVRNYSERSVIREGRQSKQVGTDPEDIILPEFASGSGWTLHYIGENAFQAHHCYSEYTGKYEDFELPYAIYVPDKEVLDAHEGGVALVIHMEHAGGNDRDPMAAVTSSRAAVKLSSAEVQSIRPAIVVVPQVEESRRSTNDFDASSEVNTAVWELLDSLLTAYKGFIDENRIYGTGQSMGGMTILNMAAQRDNFFGGICVIGAQWSNNYEKPFQNGGSPARSPKNDRISFNGWGLDRRNYRNWYYMVSDDNIFVHTCEGDPMATGEWRDLYEYYTACGVNMFQTGLDPYDELETQNAADRALCDHDITAPGSGINWSVFSRGNHMSTWKYAYQLEAPFEWLFHQSRETEQARGKVAQLKRRWRGRDALGRIRKGSGTKGLNSAQFTPGGKVNAFPEGWTPVSATRVLIEALTEQSSEREIQQAQDAYNALSRRQRRQIKNAAKLLSLTE